MEKMKTVIYTGKALSKSGKHHTFNKRRYSIDMPESEAKYYEGRIDFTVIDCLKQPNTPLGDENDDTSDSGAIKSDFNNEGSNDQSENNQGLGNEEEEDNEEGIEEERDNEGETPEDVNAKKIKKVKKTVKGE